MTVSVNGTTGITFNDASTQNTAATGFGFKNRIINGAMVIDQRNAGASVSIDGTIPYVTDRWQVQDFTDGVVSAQQVTDAPTGFVNSLKVTVTTSDASLGTTQISRAQQAIEGYNISDLAWGTASAQAITLSFWVKSSVTGTFGGSLINSGNTRSYPFTYTISAANTWEQKSLTVAGDTSGTWNTTNGIGVVVNFSLASGSSFLGTAGVWAGADYRGATGQTNLLATLSATWQVTGIQFEKGSTATNFDYRPYGTELALCQRYYQQTLTSTIMGFTGTAYAGFASQAIGLAAFKTTMRATPTVVLSDGSTIGNAVQQGIAVGAATASVIVPDGFSIVNKTSGNYNTTFGYPVLASYTASAEL